MSRFILNLSYASSLMTNLVVKAFKLIFKTLDVFEVVALLVLVLLSLIKLAVLFFDSRE